MASNPRTGKVLLFGGEVSLSAGFGLNDTWEWNGKTWFRIYPNTVPPGRSGHMMTYDPSSNRILMFGGIYKWGKTSPRKDLWAWDGRDWKLLDSGTSGAAGPGHRFAAGFSAIPGKKGVYLWGGYSREKGYKQFRDVWHWDGKAWSQVSKDTGPTVFDGGNGAWVPGTSSIIAIGKKYKQINAYKDRDNTWEFNATTNRWKLVAKSAEEPTDGNFGLAYDAVNDRLMTLAAVAPYYSFYYTWVKEPGKSWRKLKALPAPPIIRKWNRGAHLLSLPSLGLVMLHYTTPNGWETWIWDGKAWKKDPSTVIPPTDVMAFDPRRGRVLAFGYRKYPDYSLWEWYPQSGWKLLVPKVTGLPYRRYPDPFMAYDPVRDRLVMYYPLLAPKQSLIYEFDGKKWQVFQSAQIPNLKAAYIEYHPSLGGCLFFGGLNETRYPQGRFSNGSTWLWKGGKLTKLPSARLPEAFDFPWPHGACFDPKRNELWMAYRKENPTVLWKFLTGSLRVNRPALRLGETITFDVQMPQQAKHLFFGFLSLGQSPAIPVLRRKYYGVQALPLAPDALFQASMSFGLRALLSSKGRGRYSLSIPKDPRLLGLHFFGSGVTLGPSGLSAVADQVKLRITK